ncbi:hypothetical protein TNCV_4682071 [Trichonephila clavipes]|nr:hypothetical protein TNCV_4682071 [Trichonephila clavipes]
MDTTQDLSKADQLSVVFRYIKIKEKDDVLNEIKICESFVGYRTATAGSDVVQSGRPSFDDFFQHLCPYIGNNTANVVFQMVKRLWLIRIDQ